MDSLVFDDIVSAIDREVERLTTKTDFFDRSKLAHKKANFFRPKRLKLLKLLKPTRHNFHAIFHFVYRFPVIGYVLQWFLGLFLLPYHLKKLRAEIIMLRFEISKLEVKLAQSLTVEKNLVSEDSSLVESQARELTCEKY